MRLALFTDTFGPEVNGVVRSLRRLVEGFRENGGEVRVFAPGGTARNDEEEDEDDVIRWPCVPLWVYPQLRLAPPLIAMAVAELRIWRPDVVHAATPLGVGLAGRAAASALGIPFVTSYHTQLSAYASYYNLAPIAGLSWHFQRWFHNSGLRTFAPTQAVADELAERGFERLSVWSRGVDTDRFSPRHRCDRVRDALGSGPDRTIVLYVGRLAAEKGLGTGLKAVARILEAEPDAVQLVVAGDGPYERECRRFAPRGTKFLGRLEGHELASVYASADIFLFPSATESFGNVQLEGMASGLPVVAAACPVNQEVLGPAGTFAADGDVGSFARALRILIQDPVERGRLSREGLAWAANYRWSAVFDRLFDEYRSVVELGRGRRRYAA